MTRFGKAEQLYFCEGSNQAITFGPFVFTTNVTQLTNIPFVRCFATKCNNTRAKLLSFSRNTAHINKTEHGNTNTAEFRLNGFVVV